MSRPPFRNALLVEDEIHLATALEIALKQLGVPSQRAATLEEAHEIFHRIHPDLILLDRGLPDGDGLSLCSELRKNAYKGAILVLTASSQIEDRVAGLNSGADDYLPKPFSWEELGARVLALSRRISVTSPQSSKWEMDETRLRILGPQGWIELTPLEFKLVSHLISASGAIVSREDLLKKVWGFTLLPKTRTVDHFLGRLRKHFESDPERPQHFITVRGAGYRFEP